MRPRISIRGSVRPSVRPSVRRSVGPLRLCKNRVSRLFLATVRFYTETNDQPTCFESLLYYSVVSPVCSSICLSIYVTWSIHAETQSGRIFARSGLFVFSWECGGRPSPPVRHDIVIPRYLFYVYPLGTRPFMSSLAFSIWAVGRGGYQNKYVVTCIKMSRRYFRRSHTLHLYLLVHLLLYLADEIE